MSRKAVSIELTAEDETILQRRVAMRHAPISAVHLARIVLAARDGETNEVIATRVGLDRRSVALWRRRFGNERLAGLEDRPRAGRLPTGQAGPISSPSW